MSTKFTYCQDPFSYRRRKTRVVYVGEVGVGGDHPIRIQSMTIADTMDTRSTVQEVIRLVGVGCEIVRITAPSIKEAENLANIKAELTNRQILVPLVADIHYTPNAALIAAEHVEKVRINPGNYADKKRFEQRDYTDEEYQEELDRLEEKFKPLVLKCKRLGRAMRIGTNHGSLSDRIMNRYGDTPEGMVESALEFVRICETYGYREIILSMKASNPQVAIQAYRLLAARMDEYGMDYPFHLGVTEAGDGEEGRIKSAVGIGSLLGDGIGDTIRVSLTEDAEAEVPVAFRLANKYNQPNGALASTLKLERLAGHEAAVQLPDPFQYARRETLACDCVYHALGSGFLPRVELTLRNPFTHPDGTLAEVAGMLGVSNHGQLAVIGQNGASEFKCETIHVTVNTLEHCERLRELKKRLRSMEAHVPFAVEFTEIVPEVDKIAALADRLVYSPNPAADSRTLRTVILAGRRFGRPIEWKLRPDDGADSISMNLEQILEACQELDYWNLLFSLSGHGAVNSLVWPHRYLAGRLDALGANFPILLRYRSNRDFEAQMLDASTQLGSLLCDGIGDAIHIDSDLPAEDLLRLSYNILQATRIRMSKTEFISCPSCGRTLFNLQTTTARIKAKTDHLKGVKIAIMGCIVNGPGEMADADFGYVGAGQGKVNLFVGKECVERNIPEQIADEQLIELIKAHGRWVEA